MNRMSAPVVALALGLLACLGCMTSDLCWCIDDEICLRGTITATFVDGVDEDRAGRILKSRGFFEFEFTRGLSAEGTLRASVSCPEGHECMSASVLDRHPEIAYANVVLLLRVQAGDGE